MLQSRVVYKVFGPSMKFRTFLLMNIQWACLLCLVRREAYAASLQESYVGCYKLGNLVFVANSSSTTIESCIALCQRNNKTYAALQGGNICSCLDSVDTRYQSNDCNSTCNGDQSKLCGGGGRYSIYTVCPIGRYGFDCNMACHCDQQIPCDRFTGFCPNNKCYGNWIGTSCNIINASNAYLGCYNDDHWHTFLPQRVDNGQRDCSLKCRRINCTYFGLQYGVQCFCGNNYDSNRRTSESNCNYPCDDDSNVICGGSYTMSLYSVCPAGNYDNNCYARCNCANNASCNYSDGVCPSGVCKSGWSGSSCNFRDCQRNNGDCLANQKCLQLNLKYSSVARCMCESGYQRNNLWDACTDMDECSFAEPVCNESNSNCVNTVGSYQCVCKKGYRPLSSTVCIDVDECATKEAICNSTISNCVNTDGSYQCSCNDGYERFNDTFCKEKDECTSGESKCDATSTVCTNVGGGGGYKCSCKTGFRPINSLACSDVDECLTGEDRCDNVTSVCANLIGSYRCICIDGYEKSTDITCSQRSSFSLGSIIGAVVGTAVGVAALSFIIGIVVFMSRRRERESQQQQRSDGGTEGRNHSPDYEMASENYETLGASRTEHEAPYESIKDTNGQTDNNMNHQ